MNKKVVSTLIAAVVIVIALASSEPSTPAINTIYLPVVMRYATTPTGTPLPTSIPLATRTPGPSPTPGPIQNVTPIPGANWKVTKWYRLNACENHGMLRVKIFAHDKLGNPLNGIQLLRLTDTNQWPAYAFTGDKGEGLAEFDLQAGDPAGGNWKVRVDMPDQTSEWAENLATNLWLSEYCGDELGVYHGHISYDVDVELQ